MIVRLLHNMVKKNQKWDWTKKQEEALEKLKEKFTKKLVLTVLNIDRKMRMEVDTTDYVTEGVLSMECKNRK